VSPDCNSFKIPLPSHFWAHLFPPSARFALRHFLPRIATQPMDQFQKPRFYVPIEILIVVAINLVVVVAGCYALMMWGLFRS
jgi:hypothetical protein